MAVAGRCLCGDRLCGAGGDMQVRVVVGAVLLALLPSLAAAQPTPPFQQIDVDTGAATSPRVFVGLFTPASGGATAVALPTSLVSGGFQVACVSGCSGSSFADNAAFTFGTTTISILGGVLDDVASNAATENSAAAARLTAARGIHVNLRDAAGAEVSVGGGTQYTEDAAAAANPVGTALNLVRADALGALTTTDGDNVAARGTDKGELYVKHVDAIPVTDNSGSLTVDGTVTVTATNLDVQIGGSDTVTVTAANLDVQSGGADLATETTAAAILTSSNFAAAFGTAGTADAQVMSVQGIASGTALTVSATNLDVQIGGSDTVTVTDGAGAMNTIIDSGTVTTVSTVTSLSQFAGAAINLGSGTIGTGTLRVNIATDDPVNDAAVETSAAIGATAAAVPTSAIQAGGTDGTNLVVPYIDPCKREARTFYVVDIVTATTTEIANQVASEFFYLCSIFFFSAGTQNVTIVEDDTDTCGSPTAGLIGGVTAAEGPNLTAQTGWTLGNGEAAVAKTATANRFFCIITSAAVQLSGVISYVSAP